MNRSKYVSRLFLFIIWFLYIFCGLYLYADFFEKDLKRINNVNYLSSYHLQKHIPKLVIRWEPLSQRVLLLYARETIVTELDADFYVSDGIRYELENRILYTKLGVLLPISFVEKILLEFGIVSPATILGTSNRGEKNRVEKSNNFKESLLLKNIDPELSFIVLDPGHGGNDPGAIAPSKQKEKDINLLITKKIFYSFKRQFPKKKIYITRFNDQHLTLDERIKITNRRNQKNAFGIFISVHCNATIIFSTRGFEIYYLDENVTNIESRQLALRENMFSSGSQNVQKLKSYLLNAQIQRESKIFAYTLHHYLKKLVYSYIPSRGIKKANFAVLRGVLMPAILLELGYITNKKDIKVMSSKRYIDDLAKALHGTIESFTKVKRGILAYE